VNHNRAFRIAAAVWRRMIRGLQVDGWRRWLDEHPQSWSACRPNWAPGFHCAKQAGFSIFSCPLPALKITKAFAIGSQGLRIRSRRETYRAWIALVVPDRARCPFSSMAPTSELCRDIRHGISKSSWRASKPMDARHAILRRLPIFPRATSMLFELDCVPRVGFLEEISRFSLKVIQRSSAPRSTRRDSKSRIFSTGSTSRCGNVTLSRLSKASVSWSQN
jgi:hypothetical protein